MKKIITKQNKRKEYLFYSIILILFIILATIVSLKHEYWVDEAQAWLLAKDASTKDLLFKYCRTEGHQVLWYLVIKFFSLFNLKYVNFRIISLLFSSLGVALLLFKSNFKWYIKSLLPFTFFIFYQYTIITRGYCLILPLLSLLAIIWEKRKEHYLLFTTILILLINLEPYTFLLAGSIYLLELIDFLKNFKTAKKNKKQFFCIILLFLSFLLTTIYMLPIGKNASINTIVTYSSFSSGLFMPSTGSYLIKSLRIIVSAIMFVYFIYIYRKKKQERIQAFIFFIPIFLFSSIIYGNLWHEGIYFLLLLFLTCIHHLDEIKSIRILIVFCCLVQIFWSIKSSIYDYKEKYSSSIDAVAFIKKYDYENLKLYAYSFNNTELQPYFKKNIFSNWPQKERFYYWHLDHVYENNFLESKDILKEQGDIYIIYKNKTIADNNEVNELYNIYDFPANLYFKDRIIDSQTTTILVKKEIDKKT